MTLNKFSPILSRKIKIALVGCGRISENHIKSIYLHSDKAELKVICDTQKICLDKAKEKIKRILIEKSSVPKYPQEFNSYQELLEAIKLKKIEIDLIVLTTPSGLHPSQTISAAELGINVCTEKPMATNIEDGLSMVKACEKAGVKLFVVKQNRFNSTLQLVKKQIKRGRFGRLSLITVNVFWHRPQSYYDQASWRGTSDLDGGALMNQASHYVDLMYWLNGPIESLNAVSDTLGREIEVEDTLAMNLKWKNGTLGTMAVTMLTYPENLEGSITILGEKGTVKLGGKAINNFEHWNFESSNEDDLHVENSNYKTSNIYGCVLGDDVFVGPFVEIQKGVVIGDDTFISERVSVSCNCKIGKGCFLGVGSVIEYTIIDKKVTISSNTVIGKSGFGFIPNKSKTHLIPHIGGVFIGEGTNIGAGCTIDRGLIDDTFIGKYVMIDNQVHVGHNSTIDDFCILAGQVGLSGSVILKKNVTIGGDVSIKDNITIGEDSVIAGASKVFNSFPKGSYIGGSPAQNIQDWKRIVASQRLNLKKRKNN